MTGRICMVVACVTAAAGCSGSPATAGHESPPKTQHLSFASAPGWQSRGSGIASDEQAWATNLPATVRVGAVDGALLVSRLPRAGILILAGAGSTLSAPARPSRVWPARSLPLRLTDASVAHHWAEQPRERLELRMISATIAGQHVWVSVYLGSQHPTRTQLRLAQSS